MYKSAKVQSLCGGRLSWPVRRFLHPNKPLLTASSPTTNPLFFFRKFRSTNTDSKKSTRWPPSVVSSSPSSSSSASKFPVANSKSCLSISSSHDERVDQCNTLLRNTIIIRSFSSVRDDFSSPGEKSPVCALREDEKTWEYLPQRDAVVSVSGHAVDSEFAYPWRRDHRSRFGTGLILSGRRVLTTAHSVDNHTLLEVRNDYYPKSYTATMLAIAPEYDLAILTVDDDEFWEGLKPVEFGDTPSPGDKVIVDCYREDRDSLLLMTPVLRLGMTRYSFWGTELLAFQVNVGLTGATTFDERGKCVGLKLQSEGNTSDFIPAEVIKHFIQDYDKNGAYTGLPLLGIKWQEMENPYLRAFMKMEHDQQGILITEVKPNYPESVILKPYDVILSIDGININNDGTVPFLRGRRIEFSYLISKKYKGDKVVIKVRRGSEICEFITELATHKQFVPANIIGRPVPYYIIGGFAFTTLSLPYIPFMQYGVETQDEDELFSQALYEEHVVLCEVLEDDINVEYKYLVEDQVLVTFNNKPVEGLKSLVSMVETCNEDFMKFTFRNHKILVLPTNIARSRTPDILKAHFISCDMSDDLKELVTLTSGKESHICI